MEKIKMVLIGALLPVIAALIFCSTRLSDWCLNELQNMER